MAKAIDAVLGVHRFERLGHDGRTERVSFRRTSATLGEMDSDAVGVIHMAWAACETRMSHLDKGPWPFQRVA